MGFSLGNPRPSRWASSVCWPVVISIGALIEHRTEARSAPPEFQIERGFRIELVAAENLVEAPVAMAFDENGRLFVAEMREDLHLNGEVRHRGHIRLLEDKDGDGVFDTST